MVFSVCCEGFYPATLISSSSGRRELLSSAQRAQLLCLPTNLGELEKFYTLTPADRYFVAGHRTESNRIGVAVQLCFLRYPGRAWTPEETLPATMLRWIAEQVSAAPSSLQGNAERDQTRREHFIELLNEYGWRSFGLHEHRELSTWLMNQARSTDQGMALVLLLIKIFQVRPETLSDLSRSIVFEAKSRFAFTLLPTINNQRKGVGEKTTCFGCLFV